MVRSMRFEEFDQQNPLIRPPLANFQDDKSLWATEIMICAVEFMLWQPVQLTYLWNVELVKMLSGRHSYEYECPGTRKPLCSITCEEVWLKTGMSRYFIFHVTICNSNSSDFISITNKVRHHYRGGRYYRKKLSTADISEFFKLSANYRYRILGIWELSKNYRYRKMCLQFHPINSIERTVPKTRKRVFHIPGEYEIVFENSAQSCAAILAEHLVL